MTGANSLSGSVSVTPGGAGVTQALNVVVLEHITTKANATAYSVAQQLIISAWDSCSPSCRRMGVRLVGWQGSVKRSYAAAEDKRDEAKEQRRPRAAPSGGTAVVDGGYRRLAALSQRDSAWCPTWVSSPSGPVPSLAPGARARSRARRARARTVALGRERVAAGFHGPPAGVQRGERQRLLRVGSIERVSHGAAEQVGIRGRPFRLRAVGAVRAVHRPGARPLRRDCRQTLAASCSCCPPNRGPSSDPLRTTRRSCRCQSCRSSFRACAPALRRSLAASLRSSPRSGSCSVMHQ